MIASLVKPTAAEFKMRFPLFGSVADGSIDMLIDEAASVIGNCWPEAVYKLAIKYYVAHVIEVEGFMHPGGASAATSMSSKGEIVSKSVGDVSTSFRGQTTTAQSALEPYLSKTGYGLKFLELRQKSTPSVVVI